MLGHLCMGLGFPQPPCFFSRSAGSSHGPHPAPTVSLDPAYVLWVDPHPNLFRSSDVVISVPLAESLQIEFWLAQSNT